MQKHHIHASKHTFREQEVNSNVAHLSTANNTVNCLNSLLSLIRVTAGVGVCPSPLPPPPGWATGSKHKEKKLELTRKTFGYEATLVTTDAKRIKLDKIKSTLSRTNIKTCRTYSALRHKCLFTKRTSACSSESR